MGNPETSVPEHGDLAPERRTTRRRRTVAGVAGAAVVLTGGVFLVARTRDARQESLPDPPPMAAAAPSTAAESAPAPRATSSAPAPASSAAPVGAARAPRTRAATAAATTTKPAEETRKEIAEAQARAKADGFALQRPLKAKGGADESVSQWTEPVRNGTVRVTTARHDLTGSSALLPAGDRGQPVGAGVKCTNKVRFTEDAPAVERPTLLVCWKTSSTRSVVTMMATPAGVPSAAATIPIINREWAKLR